MLMSDPSESVLPQQIPSDCDRHHDHQRPTSNAPVPRPIPIVVIMPPHTTRLHVLTHSDAAIPIPSAVQHTLTIVLVQRCSVYGGELSRIPPIWFGLRSALCAIVGAMTSSSTPASTT